MPPSRISESQRVENVKARMAAIKPVIDVPTLRLLLERLEPVWMVGRAAQGAKIRQVIQEMILEAGRPRGTAARYSLTTLFH